MYRPDSTKNNQTQSSYFRYLIETVPSIYLNLSKNKNDAYWKALKTSIQQLHTLGKKPKISEENIEIYWFLLIFSIYFHHNEIAKSIIKAYPTFKTLRFEDNFLLSLHDRITFNNKQLSEIATILNNPEMSTYIKKPIRPKPRKPMSFGLFNFYSNPYADNVNCEVYDQAEVIKQETP